MPQISIIVPVFNAAGTLDRCVESILSQTVKDIEVILVDDGSADGSAALCDRWMEQDQRIQVIHQQNAGVSSARNCGIEESTGDYLLFVDADDWIEPDMVSSLIEAIHNGNADIAICTFQFEYSASSECVSIHELKCSVSDLLDAGFGMTEMGVYLCSPVNKLYRRSIIEQNGLWFQYGMRFGEDFTFNAQYFCAADRIASIDRALYHYDCSISGSGVKTLYRDYDSIILTMDKAFSELRRLKGTKETEDLQNRFIADRWDYATVLCETSELPDSEKTQLLFKWFQSVPLDKWNPYAKTGGAFSRYAQRICAYGGEVRAETIASIYRENRKRRKQKAQIIMLKRTIKRLLGMT